MFAKAITTIFRPFAVSSGFETGGSARMRRGSFLFSPLCSISDSLASDDFFANSSQKLKTSAWREVSRKPVFSATVWGEGGSAAALMSGENIQDKHREDPAIHENS